MVIDDATIEDRSATRLLRMLVGHRGLELYATTRGAPWRVEISDEPNANNALDVRYIQPDGTDRYGLWAGDGIGRHAATLSDELGLPPDTMTRLLRFRQAALHHQLDAVVTDVVLPRRSERARPGLPLDLAAPERACALAGLYMRAHNDFTVDVEQGTKLFLTSERFYRAVAVAAIDAGSWLADADDVFIRGDAVPRRLLGGMTTRLARMLRMRDAHAVRLRHWRPDETWDESLALFEASLLFMSGALDAAARYLAARLGVAGHGRASFRNPPWMNAVAGSHTNLREVLDDAGELCATASAVAAVRNLIHERAPSEELESFHDAQATVVDHQPGVIVLDGDDARRLTEAVQRLGGAEAAGLQEAWAGAVTVLPFVLLPMLVNATFAQLRRLVQATAEHPRDAAISNGLATDARRYGAHLLLLTGLTAHAERQDAR